MKMKLTKIFLSLLVVFSLGSVVQAQLKLNGAGATFPYVIYSKWFDAIAMNALASLGIFF
jgi:hypothetical protein